MRKGRQQHSSPRLGPIKRDLPEVFLRLCHHCLFLNESDREIRQCERCEKSFDPKQGTNSYGFKDRDSDDDLDPSLEQTLDSLEEEVDSSPQESVESVEGHQKPFRKPLVNGLNVKW